MLKRGREREGWKGGGAIEMLFVPDAGGLRRNQEGVWKRDRWMVSINIYIKYICPL